MAIHQCYLMDRFSVVTWAPEPQPIRHDFSQPAPVKWLCNHTHECDYRVIDIGVIQAVMVSVHAVSIWAQQVMWRGFIWTSCFSWIRLPIAIFTRVIYYAIFSWLMFYSWILPCWVLWGRHCNCGISFLLNLSDTGLPLTFLHAHTKQNCLDIEYPPFYVYNSFN